MTKNYIKEELNMFGNNGITGMIDMVTKRRSGKSRCRKLDKDHPTIKVIKRFTNPIRYWESRRLIEKYYPAVCNFDVTI